jgi:hypothetical protein
VAARRPAARGEPIGDDARQGVGAAAGRLYAGAMGWGLLLLRGGALGLGVLALNLLSALLVVLIYAFGFAPGHDPAHYQAFAGGVAAVCAIVPGLPLIFAAAWANARAAPPPRLLPAALAPALVYVALDAAILAAAGVPAGGTAAAAWAATILVALLTAALLLRRGADAPV